MEEPDLEASDEFFLEAFDDLSSTRGIGFSVGPIPWNRTMEYAVWKGLDVINTRVLVAVIKAMDQAYLDWMHTKSDDG